MAPRVRPRIPLEDRVDPVAHPGIRGIPTESEGEEVQPKTWAELHWTRKTALALLGVFLVAGTVGCLAAIWVGPWAALAGVFLSGAALTASILLGGE